MSIPAWTTQPSTVWVTPDGVCDPRMPAGAMILSVEEATAWVADPEAHPTVAQMRMRGATAMTAPDAPAEIRALVRQLRAKLAVSSAPALGDLADALDAPVLGARLRRWPRETALSFANLSAAAAGPNGQFNETARLLLALEYL